MESVKDVETIMDNIVPKLLSGRLIERIKRTTTVESFRFAFEKHIAFTPGQFLQVIFDKNNFYNKEVNKYLSFSSAPTEETIEVTKRLSTSLFSQKLQALKKGDLLDFRAPLGTCIFRDEDKQIVFLIGGIGITPVISIIKYIVHRSLPTDVILFYSNRTEEEIAFKEDLDKWQQSGKIKVFHTLTDCTPKDDVCLSGIINKNMIQERVQALHKKIFFIYGPPKMVEAMSAVCADLGCSKQALRIEVFAGY